MLVRAVGITSEPVLPSDEARTAASSVPVASMRWLVLSADEATRRVVVEAIRRAGAVCHVVRGGAGPSRRSVVRPYQFAFVDIIHPLGDGCGIEHWVDSLRLHQCRLVVATGDGDVDGERWARERGAVILLPGRIDTAWFGRIVRELAVHCTGSQSRGVCPVDDPTTHWNAIFTTKDDTQLGWYEADVSRTLAFLDRVPASDGTAVFLPGAGTSLLVDELLARGARLVVNDVSDAALGRLRRRLGARSPRPVWLHHDIATPLPDGLPPCDLWIDRAVLHFLRDEPAIDGYFQNLRAMLRPGGHVFLAEFATTGAPRCAGLDVHRYSPAEMAARLGDEFALVHAEDVTFVNPAGETRPYVYALFRRS